MAETLIPHGDHVLVQLDKSVEVSSGGIHLPQIAREKPQMGTVVALGERRHYNTGEIWPYPFKIGTRVLVNVYAGKEFKDDQKLYPSGDILAYIADVTVQTANVVKAKSA